MKAPSFDYARPRHLDEAVALLAGAPGAKLLAGGQSLGPMLNLRVVAPALLVDIGRLAELAGIEEQDDTICIGAGVTHAEIEDGAVPDPARAMLRHVARGIAYRAVRNRGTLGGSLVHADPSADWVAAMSALGARLVIVGHGPARETSMPGFMVGALTTSIGDDEILKAVKIPRLSARAGWGYCKLCRKTGEFAHAIGAVVIDPARDYRRAVIAATGDVPVAIEDADPLLDELLSADFERALAAARRLVERGKVGGDAIARQLHAAALARAAHQARPR